jgi:hypothetical protein
MLDPDIELPLVLVAGVPAPDVEVPPAVVPAVVPADELLLPDVPIIAFVSK